MGVIRVGDCSGRRSWIDRLLCTAVQPLHPRVTAVVQTLHDLPTPDPTHTCVTTRGTVTCRAAMWAKVAAVVQAALLPTDGPWHTTGAATAVAITHQLAEQSATGIALLAAIVAVHVMSCATGCAEA